MHLRRTGDYGRNQLYGDDGNDKVMGGSDDDTVDGGPGSDQIFGDSGYLEPGSDGSDVILARDGVVDEIQ